MIMGICSKCKETRQIVCKSNNQNLCGKCYNEINRKVICSVCGELRIAATKIDGKTTLCHKCYDASHTEICCICNELKTICTRNKDGKSICGNCRSKMNAEVCKFCKQLKPVNARSDTHEPICTACYNLYIPEQMFRTYKTSTKSRNYVFEISFDEFSILVHQPCWYCGDYNRAGIMSGLDRIDNNIGYVLNNVIPCCPDCNKMKLTMSQDNFFCQDTENFNIT
ncbi:MAG: hypothetical protein WC516_07210 [Patescibacteria group bacterium]